ncbi:MAG: hypothetical protein WA709_17285 [Stellaceae bacterium]
MGPEGLRDRRIGKPSSRRAAAEEIRRMLGLYEERYAGFTVKHFHEQLQKRHHYKLGYTVTRLALHGAGLVGPAPRRSAHRKKRPRRPMVGMMLHQSLPSRKRGTSRASPGAGRRAAIRSGGHPRRRDQRGLFGVYRRGGRHGVELSRAGRGDRPARAVLWALHRSRQSLFPHAQGRGAGVERACKPRSGARWRRSPSAKSRPIRPRRAAA